MINVIGFQSVSAFYKIVVPKIKYLTHESLYNVCQVRF